jgi:8-oxo-dGTP pyrophosphatase MutT (NUDIX family)
MAKKELDILRYLVGNHLAPQSQVIPVTDITYPFPTTFEALHRSIIYGFDRDIDYARTRFLESIPLLAKLLPIVEGEPDTEWLWPKGRMYATSETPHHCALREFQEETGITIRGQHPISPRPLFESFRGANGRVYETRCWVYVFPDEVPPPPLLDLGQPGEIGDRRWVTNEEALGLLKPSKINILTLASRLLSLDSGIGPEGDKVTKEIKEEGTREKEDIQDKDQDPTGSNHPPAGSNQDKEWTEIRRRKYSSNRA